MPRSSSMRPFLHTEMPQVSDIPLWHPCKKLTSLSSPHETLRCSQPCRERLPCGHGCESYCGQACSCSCDIPQQPRPSQPFPAFPGILQPRNGDHQTTPGQWKTFASNIAVHDENLNLDHAALVKTQQAEVTTTVIKEIYRPTTVLDGFRVEGSQKDVARIEVPTPPRTPRHFEEPRSTHPPSLERLGATGLPPHVLFRTETPQLDSSEIPFDRLSISGNDSSQGGSSGSSLEAGGQEVQGEEEEELLIEF